MTDGYSVNTGTVIELRIPPNRMDLVLDQTRVLLESGYDVAIERVFNAEFVPPSLIYYSVNVQCEMTFVDETGKADDKNDK